MRILLLLLVVGCAKKQHPTGPAGRQAEAGQDGIATPPYNPIEGDGAAIELPPLGDPDAFGDLKSLSKASLTFRLDADLSGLAVVDADKLPVLLAQLRADPSWRLTWREGVVVAEQRVRGRVGRIEGWTTGPGGYQTQDGEDHIWRIGLRFGPASPDGRMATSQAVAHHPVGEGSLRLHSWRLTQPEWEGWESASCTVEGAVVAMEVHELGKPLELGRLPDALASVPPWVGAVADWPRDRAEGGWARGLLPPSEPAAGSAYVSATLSEDGRIEVFGRMNPGRSGWAWARILSPAGEPWEEVTLAEATLEGPGWSTDPAELFWFDGRAPLAALPPKGSRVEIWFVPEGGVDPERLGSWALDPES